VTSAVSASKKRRLLEQDGGRCHYCRCALSVDGVVHPMLTCDHVVPIARGGQRVPANEVASCQACNLAKDDGDGTCTCQRCCDARERWLGYRRPLLRGTSILRAEERARRRSGYGAPSPLRSSLGDVLRPLLEDRG